MKSPRSITQPWKRRNELACSSYCTEDSSSRAMLINAYLTTYKSPTTSARRQWTRGIEVGHNLIYAQRKDCRFPSICGHGLGSRLNKRSFMAGHWVDIKGTLALQYLDPRSYPIDPRSIIGSKLDIGPGFPRSWSRSSVSSRRLRHVRGAWSGWQSKAKSQLIQWNALEPHTQKDMSWPF